MFIQCDGCGFGSLDGEAPDHDYWRDPTREDEIDETFWRDAKLAQFNRMLELMESEISGRRLLDIGGGAGFFVETALNRGWDAYSFDTSERITAHAAERIGPDRALRSTDHLPLGSFDLVTLWCVVAHVPDAEVLWTSAASHLADGGSVWLTTPNYRFEKLKARLASSLAGRSIDFWAADHVGHFMPRTVEKVLTDHGFDQVRQRFCGITETCMVSKRAPGLGVRAKRAFNASAYRMSRLGMPVLASELQVTAVKTGS